MTTVRERLAVSGREDLVHGLGSFNPEPEAERRKLNRQMLFDAFKKATKDLRDNKPSMALAYDINSEIPCALLSDDIPLDHLILIEKKQKSRDKGRNPDEDEINQRRGNIKKYWNIRLNYFMNNLVRKPEETKPITLGDLRESKKCGFVNIRGFKAVTPDSFDFLLMALAQK